MGSSQPNTINLDVDIILDPRILIKSLVAEAYRAESFTIEGNLDAPKVANDYHQENNNTHSI